MALRCAAVVAPRACQADNAADFVDTGCRRTWVVCRCLEMLTDRHGLTSVPPELLPPDLDHVAISRAEGAMAATHSTPFEAIRFSLILLWGIGSALVLMWSLVHIYRFNQLLCMASETATPELQRTASQIARRLRLKSTPIILTVSTHLSPMVWWNGGRVCVLVPANLTKGLSAEQHRWILAHELCHVRRRDHLVRWVEWLTCVMFWWNPVAWWARRNLRINEEVCCDALVLTTLAPHSRSYANALVTAVESLTSPAIRPPAMASKMNSGASLEWRLDMIVSNHPISKSPRWLKALLLCSPLLLPLGGTYAQDLDLGAEERFIAFDAPKAGSNWSASSGAARAITGDIRVAESKIAFANGSSISIRPTYPGARNVFMVDPVADPPMLNSNHLCGSPVTYVVLLSYHAYALAVHMYDVPQPPEEPTPANVHEFARMTKCASYYYRVAP